MPRFHIGTLVVLSLFTVFPRQSIGAEGPWDISALQKPPAYQWLDESSPVRSLTYENEPYQGQTTDVFAFYATPGSVAGDPTLDKNLPAVVLVHGGGGTAFAEWAWLWAKRGYAAIAMDLSGRRPTPPTFDPETGEIVLGSHRDLQRTRLPRGGPEQGHVEKFANVGGDMSDDWQVHSVSAVLRAHSLLQSFEEVDPERTAVTGISWGGYLTCIVASIDDRFKAAVPVYGCGFLYEGESVQRPRIDGLDPDKRAEWIRMYEPSAWLPQCEVPVFFVNGTNDKNYPIDNYARSYRLVRGPRTIRIEVNMPHGHPPGWQPNEIGLFIDSYLRDGAPLPQLGKPQNVDGQATASCTAEVPIERAQLHYTTEDGPTLERSWQSVSAQVDSQSITAKLPENATIWFLSATDERDAMVSTEVVFVP